MATQKWSNSTQTIEWCYDHGKAFKFLNTVHNICELGAEINLEAVNSITRQSIIGIENTKVHYYNPYCDLSSVEVDKKYHIKLSNGKEGVVQVSEKTDNYVYFTNGMMTDLDGVNCNDTLDLPWYITEITDLTEI